MLNARNKSMKRKEYLDSKNLRLKVKTWLFYAIDLRALGGEDEIRLVDDVIPLAPLAATTYVVRLDR